MVLAVHAAMIEQLDKNVGKMINYLKSIGKYDNTFIMFSTDNSSSEPVEILGFKYATGVDLAKGRAAIHLVNNSLNNLGNANSDFNYGAWGTYTSVSPFSGWKASQFEGAIRFPLLVKMPNTMASTPSPSSSNTPSSSSSSNTNLVKSFAFVNDITPTILELAKVSHPDTYKGKPVHAMMGKSLVPILTGATDKVYSDDEPIAMELFNATSVRMGDWKALTDQVAPEKWKLFNVANDLGENNDLSAQHPDILQKMIAAYEKYSKDVGVVIPRGGSFAAIQKHGIIPIDNSTQVTISLKDMIPGYKGAALPPQNYTNN
jgi:arylsulfatase A-like enzyme